MRGDETVWVRDGVTDRRVARGAPVARTIELRKDKRSSRKWHVADFVLSFRLADSELFGHQRKAVVKNKSY